MEWSEAKVLSAALLLGARSVRGWTPREERLVRGLPTLPGSLIETLQRQIRKGADPLGDIFCELRVPSVRRQVGATYTPFEIVRAMVDLTASRGEPSRVVDPGAGSGRFMLVAGKRFQRAELVGSETDPVAAIIARANIAASGLSGRATIALSDYRELSLPAITGTTLFIGNPPYVRHHLLEPKWKQWLVVEAAKLGFEASQLAGLHVHFFLSTILKARPGDYGSFITAAEWLDVNYGGLVRCLFLSRLGGERIVVIEPTAKPFPDAATTAAITSFRIGNKPSSIKFKRINSLIQLQVPNGGRAVRRERLEAERRWSHFSRAPLPEKEGYVELGELCRVHRGQVTGANRIWIGGPHSQDLPSSVLYPSITRARELIRAGLILDDVSSLRRVIDLPVDLDCFDSYERKAIDRFLRKAKSLGGDQSFIARNRKAWWSVGLREPAPILATYMARRPPAFVRNIANARHINIAHGLYPRERMSERMLTALVSYLSSATSMVHGRTYAGGLTKFEPREMERLFVPSLELLSNYR